MEEQKLYDKYLEGKHWENHPTIYAEKYASFLKEHNFKGLLVDLGCGNGRDVNAFQELGFNVLGIDYSEEEIKLSREKFPECKFELQNVESLTFKDNSISGFFMINVIHYVKPEKAFKELFRTLVPRGYLFIHFNLTITDTEGNIDYEQNEEDIQEMIKDFKVIKKRIFERVDSVPLEHTHKILELVLQK